MNILQCRQFLSNIGQIFYSIVTRILDAPKWIVTVHLYEAAMMMIMMMMMMMMPTMMYSYFDNDIDGNYDYVVVGVHIVVVYADDGAQDNVFLVAVVDDVAGDVADDMADDDDDDDYGDDGDDDDCGGGGGGGGGGGRDGFGLGGGGGGDDDDDHDDHNRNRDAKPMTTSGMSMMR